jgi:short-subunit dehydrogenase
MSVGPSRQGDGRVALVTGASSGLGCAFAEEFARHGFGLVLTARRAERLAALAADLSARYKVRAIILPDDLADPAAPSRIFEAIAREGLAIDALVNNAGYGVAGQFEDSAWPAHRDFLEVLIRAPTALAHLALPGMRARGYGRIVNIASLAGFLPATLGSTLYSAAKSYLTIFSESLALETQGSGIHVTAICPGLTHTEFHGTDDLRPDIARMPAWVWMDAPTVACEGYDAVMRGRPLVVTGAHNAFFAALLRALPLWALRPIIRRVMSP